MTFRTFTVVAYDYSGRKVEHECNSYREAHDLYRALCTVKHIRHAIIETTKPW